MLKSSGWFLAGAAVVVAALYYSLKPRTSYVFTDEEIKPIVADPPTVIRASDVDAVTGS